MLSAIKNVRAILSGIYNWTKNRINHAKDSKLFKSTWSYALDHPKVTLGAIAASVILGLVGILVGFGAALIYLMNKKDYDAKKPQATKKKFSS